MSGARERPMTAPKFYRVLVADDHAIVRRGVRVLLELQPDVQVCGEARTGVEAMDIARNEKPDLLILDLTMPRLSGRDTLKRLVEMNPDVRVMFSSGYSAEQVSGAECRQVLGFINKPYRADELAAQLRNTLDRSGAPQ